nr:2-hydroxymuconate tautomerase [Kibdelosporangium phytohabitans]
MIKVSMFPGRTDEQKQALIKELTEAFLRTCGGKREGVWVMIEEVQQQHWGVGGHTSGAPLAGE